MRFFTAELIIQFNSADDEEADRADEAWEAAIHEYRDHLDRLRDRMPSPVRELAERSLHDAELLACDQPIEPFFASPFEPFPLWTGFAILSVRRDNEILSLIYVLWDRSREYEAGESWPFSRQQKHWLYDEIDAVPDARGRFLHRILFSDGSVMEIPFLSAVIHRLPP